MLITHNPRTIRQRVSTQNRLKIAVIALVVAASPLNAQEVDGLSLKLGETDLYPEVRIDYFQNSNGFLTPDDETSVTGVTVSPSVRWVADRRLAVLRASYEGEYEQTSETALDFADHLLEFEALGDFSKRFRGASDISFRRLHEELGRGLTRGIGDNADDQVEINDLRAEASVTYGAQDARGNIELGVFVQDRGPINLDEINPAADTGRAEFTLLRPFGIFSLRVSPDTRALLEIRFDDFDIKDRVEGASNDRSQIGVLGGLRFSTTGKLGGSIRLGSTRITYADDRDDATEFIAEGALFYLPVAYSRFDLRLTREVDDISGVSTGLQAESIRDELRLNWRHDWSERVFHRAFAGIEAFTRECPAIDDSTTTAAFELNLNVRRWLEIGAGVTADSRVGDTCDVDDVDLDYTRQIIGAHIRATL